ncbi:MAG: amidohydrolase family protein [Thermoleophilia bacterium]|nr:amidohydrolase family protein [Thermoleophilia bacterium]
MVLLSADWVVPVSTPPIAGGAVLVVDGKIGAVGRATELRARYPEEPVEEFAGCALLPGLVNAHTHLDYSAFRGFTRGGSFGGWMLRLLLASGKLGIDDYAASALWGAHQCARGGVTSIGDTSNRAAIDARAALAVGLRARVYQEIFGLDDAELPKAIQRLELKLGQLRHESQVQPRSAGSAAGSGAAALAAAGPRVEWGISPHAPYTVPPRLYREAARFARRAGLRMATHLAESEAEVEMLVKGAGAIAKAYKAAHLWKRQRWTAPGLSPVQYVAGTGALGPDMLAVHVIQVDGDDIATLAATGTAVAHCPRSNRRLRCGIAPVAEMRAAGITVGLGTDSLASNDSLDMFDEMRAALAVSVAREGATGGLGAAAAPAGADPTSAAAAVSPGVLTPSDVLRMATLEGAQALGWDHLVGSLEAGKRADIVAVEMPHAGASDPIAALVRAGSAADVRMTMVDGRPVFWGEELSVEVREGLRAARFKLGLSG